MNQKVTSGLVALLAIGAASVAFAQSQPPSSTTSPSTTPPPSSYPEGRDPNATSSSSMSSESHKQLLKDCMANEKAKNNGETKEQIKEICQSQLKQSESPR